MNFKIILYPTNLLLALPGFGCNIKIPNPDRQSGKELPCGISLVSETARHPLDHLNTEILSLQHSVVHLEPYSIQDTPEIIADHPANFQIGSILHLLIQPRSSFHFFWPSPRRRTPTGATLLP